MVRLSIVIALIVFFFTPSFAQNKTENKVSADSCVKILIAPTEKSAILLDLNGDLFLGSMKDIQSFDPKIVSIFEMYNPDAKECAGIRSRSKVKGVDLIKIFKINTKEGEKLPSQFLKNNK